MADLAGAQRAAAGTPRIALGISYDGSRWRGWQSQPDGQTVQDHVEAALSRFADAPVRTVCAGRTDAGVHAFNQVIHLDPPVPRDDFSWIRGTNRYLDEGVAVQWCRRVGDDFHARYAATGRRYRYLLLQSAVRPALEARRCGWVFRALDGDRMQAASRCLLGEHDFSAFRSSECQARSPVKHLRAIGIERRGSYWRLDFDASAFLHHMVRNIVGCLVAVGSGARPAGWLEDVLRSGRRENAAPTFAPDGLYFIGPYYDARHGIPEHTPAMGWHP